MPEALTGLLATLHFLRPLWLLAIAPALWLAWRWSRQAGGDSHWESRIAPELLDVLLEPGARRRSRRLPWLIAFALSLATLGLAGPTWQRLPQPVEQRSDSLVILFDLSLSMFAEDLAPSRLVRARQKIADVLRRREEGFTALVAYAGDAHAVVPLTDDTRTIENLLNALRPDMMPVLGSNLAAALDQAEELFENAGVSQGRILVVTDGVDEMGHATERRDPRFPISILGIGTPEGATIPLDFVNQPGQVLRSQQGDPILARLDEDRLTRIVEVTHGHYRRLTLSDSDIDDLLSTPLPGDDETTEVEREFDTWADMGFLVTLLLLPVALGGFRRGAVAALPLWLGPLLLCALPRPAAANVWDDLWQRHDQQAYQTLSRGEPESAAALFERDDWRAAALYRSGEYPAAADAYRGQTGSDAEYNLGNALARQHEYDAAIAAYDAVLARQPDHEDAKFNKALLEKLRDAEQQAEQNQRSRDPGDDEPQEPPAQGNGAADSADDPSQAGQLPDQPPPEDADSDREGEPEEGDQQQSEEELAASRDEKRDALEQWLRRVPDDPGGLLRRKFQYETNQRLRRGDYRSQETEKIW